MDIDVERYLGAVERIVAPLERNGKPARAVTLKRVYDTDIEDLWDALTNKERLPRWFAPVSGDFHLGGRYSIKGNAEGTIEECREPEHLALTWEFGGDVSWVTVDLKKLEAGKTEFTLVHTANLNDHWGMYGPGAVGIGWELGLLGLALHLSHPDGKMDEEEFAFSPEGKAFITGSGNGWGEADIAGGEDAGDARKRAGRTIAFYTGAPQPE